MPRPPLNRADNGEHALIGRTALIETHLHGRFGYFCTRGEIEGGLKLSNASPQLRLSPARLINCSPNCEVCRHR